MSLLQLLEARESNKDLDGKFLDLRRDRVSGENVHNEDEVIDAKLFCSKSKTTFQERFEEGTFHELWSFCKIRKLPFQD